MFYLGLVAFDHVRHRVWIIQNVFTDGRRQLRKKYDDAKREIEHTRRKLEGPLPRREAQGSDAAASVESNFTKARYITPCEKAKEYIRAGDIFQVVPSQRFSAATSS